MIDSVIMQAKKSMMETLIKYPDMDNLGDLRYVVAKSTVSGMQFGMFPMVITEVPALLTAVTDEAFDVSTDPNVELTPLALIKGNLIHYIDRMLEPFTDNAQKDLKLFWKLVGRMTEFYKETDREYWRKREIPDGIGIGIPFGESKDPTMDTLLEECAEELDKARLDDFIKSCYPDLLDALTLPVLNMLRDTKDLL